MWDVSDEALLAGYATGDPQAAIVFLRRFQRQMIGLASAITHDGVEAEEVAQDALVRAWRYAGSYDARRGSVRAWLLGIVRNVALDRVRVSGRRRELSVDQVRLEIEEAAPDPADAVGVRDEAARALSSLQALPAEQRDTLIAVTIHGLSAREVSEAWGVPLGTVKTRIRLGLRRLRQRVGSNRT